MKYFSAILPIKKSKIKNNYQIINSHMLKIQKLINSRKILKAKIQLGELFTELCDLSDIIDLADYNDLKTFKDMFLNQINYPPLFGAITLNNEKLIKTELSRIVSNIAEKLEELTSYLEAYPLK